MSPRHVHPGDLITAGWANSVSSELRRASRITAAYPLQVTAGAFGINIALTGDNGFDLVELIDTVEANDFDKTATLFSFDSTETDPWIKALDGASDPITLAHVANAQQSLYLAGERHLTFWHPAAGQRIPIPGVQWHFGKLAESLSAGGSATVEVWQVNSTSGDMEDSSHSVTAYDWLLSSGDSLPSGAACDDPSALAIETLVRIRRELRVVSGERGAASRERRAGRRRSEVRDRRSVADPRPPTHDPRPPTSLLPCSPLPAPSSPLPAPMNRFSPSCNCCNCVVFADAFDRSEIGSNWSIQSGTWSIPLAEGGLQTTSANAEIDQAAGGDAGKATASVGSTASGDQLQVGLGSAGNFFAAELEVGSGAFRLVSVSGGVRTVLRECNVSAAAGAMFTIGLCSDTYPYGSTTIRLYTAIFQGTSLHTWGDSIGPCETFGGVLATGAISGTASFASFAMSNVQCDDPSCPNCSQCCWPPGAALPSQVQVVISGLGPSSGESLGECTDAECDAINGTYLLDPAEDCTASYTSCPEIPCCACYELTDLDLTCASVADPITTIRFLAFNSSGGFCQGPGQCNLYVDLCTASGFVAFHFDLGLGPAPTGFAPSEACGTSSTTDGCPARREQRCWPTPRATPPQAASTAATTRWTTRRARRPWSVSREAILDFRFSILDCPLCFAILS